MRSHNPKPGLFQGFGYLHSRGTASRHLHTRTQGLLPVVLSHSVPLLFQNLGDLWKCTTAPCLSEFFPKKRVRAKKDVHTVFPLLESSLSWGTPQKPALFSTRSAFEQMSHRQSALNFLLGDISAPANAWLTDYMSFLGSVIWKDAAIGQNKGAQPDPHILSLEIRHCSF